MKRIQILILILLSSMIAFAQTIPAPPYTPMPAKAYNFKGFVIVDSALKANTILTTTPAVNDSSKKVATTEWIKQQGNILYPAYSFQRSIDAGNLLTRDNEINGQSYNFKWFRNKWFNLNQKSENIGYDVENDFIQADSGTYLTYKKYDNINDVIIETNKISIGEKDIKMELNDSVKTSLLINRDSITVSIDPLNTDSSHAIATTAFVKRNSGGSGGGSTDTTFLRRDININSAQGVANAAAIQQRIDSLRNNAGTLEARKGGVFVPQFVLPSGGGSNLNLATYYIRALNDSTIYFDSSLVVTSVAGINDSTIRITKGNGATNDVQIKGGANTGVGSGITVSYYGKNASRDSTILLLSDGTRYAAKDSTGGGGGSAAGANTEIQYNNAGAFGASSGFKWDGQIKITPTATDAATNLEAIKATGSNAGAITISLTNTFSTTGREYRMQSNGDGTFSIVRLVSGTGNTVVSFDNNSKATLGGVLSGGSSTANSYTLGNATGIGGAFWVSTTPSNSNYAVYGDGTSNYFNSGSDMLFRTANANKGRIFNSTGNWIFGTSTTDNGAKVQTTSISTAYTATATSLTADPTHNVIDITATGQTITLPTAASITGRHYTIKLTALGTGTVATTSSQTIDGITTYSLSAQYKYVTVQSTGSNWIIIANN